MKITTNMATTITPKMAKEWLGNGNNYRKLDERWVKRWAEEISSGSWVVNGESIKFDDDGDLVDGQHRLAAIVRTGIATKIMVIYGVQSMANMDQNKGRRLVDTLIRMGEKNTNTLGAAIRISYAHDTFGIRGDSGKLINISSLLKHLRDNPELRVSANKAATEFRSKILSAGITAGLHSLFSRVDAEIADWWCQSLKTGDGIKSTDPVGRLRSRLIDDKASVSSLPKLDIIALSIKSFNYTITGQTCGTLRWRSSGPKAEAFPEIVGLG